MTKFSLTVKTDDVTSDRRGVDPHGRFRGEWINQSFVFFLFVFLAKVTRHQLSKAQNIVT